MYKRKRPHVECPKCGRDLMPSEDGRFRPHVRVRKSAITQTQRRHAGGQCPMSGRRALMAWKLQSHAIKLTTGPKGRIFYLVTP